MENALANSYPKNSKARLDGGRRKLLPRRFFARDTHEVARDLLGKVLVVRQARGPYEQITAGRIVETEAYMGDDPASHSATGKTARTSPMFEAAGIAYVYFIYGMYEMLNFVTEAEHVPGAVLIRAVEPLEGFALMRRRRGPSRRDWTNGPGRLCRAMGIRMKHNRASLRGPELFVYDDGFRSAAIHVSPRVGITKAIEQEWRYFIAGNPYVSRSRQNRAARPWSTPASRKAGRA
ncbi:MAG: DNA-3-methyladenine glycosylase [Bacteriovoracia bacterium]